MANWQRPKGDTYYDEWVEREGLDLIRGSMVENVYTLPLKPWARSGGSAVRIQLEGTGEVDDAYIGEIPPGKQLEPMRHFYEEVIFILSGQGSTTVWYDGQCKNGFEWQKGSLFAIPMNAWHQHFNLSGTDPVRFMAVTTAPVMMNLLRSDDAIFDNPTTFPERYDSSENYFTSQFTMKETAFRETGVDKFECAFTNFVWDINAIPPQKSARAEGARGRVFELGPNRALHVHSTLIPGRTYSNAHRHGPGAHVLWLSGEGYALMWPDSGEKQKLYFGPGSIIVPQDWWWHHWAVLSEEPAQDFAVTLGGIARSRSAGIMISTKEGGSMMTLDEFAPGLIEEIQSIYDEESKAYFARKQAGGPATNVELKTI